MTTLCEWGQSWEAEADRQEKRADDLEEAAEKLKARIEELEARAMPECKTCKWFVLDGQYTDEARRLKYGECRLNAPVILPIGEHTEGGGGVQAETLWPMPYYGGARKDPWCGKCEDAPSV